MAWLDLLPFDDTCRRLPRRRGALALLATLALAAGCGGGGDAGSTLTTAVGATAYTQGTVTGFGSVIVNGVRYDDSGVQAVDEDGLHRSLGLGMRVSLDSSTAADGSHRAHAVRVGAQVLGPARYDSASSTLTVLGQTIDITPTTVLDSRLADVAAADGQVIEVHGVTDVSTGHIVATRLEVETGVTAYKLRGTVAALDTTLKTFQIGGATIGYAALDASLVPSTLADGLILRVSLATTPNAGVWTAQSLGIRASTPADGAAVQVRGSITSFTSTAAFSVDGLAVTTSAATRFPDGSTGLVAGAQVEVQGTMVNGVLAASSVELESAHQHDDDRRIELHGLITAVNATDKTFVLRGVNVSYASMASDGYVDGTEAGLVVGARVAVKGGVGSTRSLVVATRIQFGS